MKPALIFLDMGGPASLEDIPRFLHSLFSDKFILPLPWPFRQGLARYIVRKSTSHSISLYEKIGGKSPVPVQLDAFTSAIENALDIPVYWASRHGERSIAELVVSLKRQDFDRLYVLPTCPHETKSMAGSFISRFDSEIKKIGFAGEVLYLKSYPESPSLLDFWVSESKKRLKECPDSIILFSVHGLPEKQIEKGDPYLDEVKKSLYAYREKMAVDNEIILCFQSNVNIDTWLKPDIGSVVNQCGARKKSLIVLPASFLFNHVETLVELDEDMRKIALHAGCPSYERLSVPSSDPLFTRSFSNELSSFFSSNTV